VNEYLKWNDLLAVQIFRPEMEGRHVYLYVTEKTIEEVGTQLGAPDKEEFIKVVESGPTWVTRRGLCQRALQACQGWRERKLDWPPHKAYLSLFVLAAGIEGDFAQHAYYPRLRWLLGYEAGGMLPSFDQMLGLWDDLEIWSAVDRNGRLGVFESKFVGSWINVGVPIAQTILTEHERKVIPKILAADGVEPALLPPDPEIARVLRARGSGELRPRTIGLLSTRQDEERYGVLMGIIREECLGWEQQFEIENTLELPGEDKSFGSLRLCLQLDQVARRATATLRCRINKELPEDGLNLNTPDLSRILHCDEFRQGGSTPIVEVESKTDLNAAIFN